MFAKIKPNTQIIGQNLVYFARLNSTNSYAVELFRHNLAETGTVVVADEQTAGRGQLERPWVSNPYENLMFSIILKPVTNVMNDPFLINKCLTLAVCYLIAELLPSQEVKIKWPNDIMVNQKKIAGILVENSFSGHHLNVSIVGVGINVNQNFTAQPVHNATSLFDNRKEVFDRVTLLQQVLEKADYFYMKLIENQTAFINSDFEQHLLGFGEEGQFTENGREFTAIIIGCDNDGRLILNCNHTIKSYLHGEITQKIAI